MWLQQNHHQSCIHGWFCVVWRRSIHVCRVDTDLCHFHPQLRITPVLGLLHNDLMSQQVHYTETMGKGRIGEMRYFIQSSRTNTQKIRNIIKNDIWKESSSFMRILLFDKLMRLMFCLVFLLLFLGLFVCLFSVLFSRGKRTAGEESLAQIDDYYWSSAKQYDLFLNIMNDTICVNLKGNYVVF